MYLQCNLYQRKRSFNSLCILFLTVSLIIYHLLCCHWNENNLTYGFCLCCFLSCYLHLSLPAGPCFFWISTVCYMHCLCVKLPVSCFIAFCLTHNPDYTKKFYVWNSKQCWDITWHNKESVFNIVIIISYLNWTSTELFYVSVVICVTSLRDAGWISGLTKVTIYLMCTNQHQKIAVLAAPILGLSGLRVVSYPVTCKQQKQTNLRCPGCPMAFTAEQIKNTSLSVCNLTPQEALR